MKKITFSFKSLLVAAGLLIGSANAWGQTTTTLLEYGTNEVAWTSEGLATWSVPTNDTYLTSGFDDADNPSYFSISTKATYNAGYEVSKTISPTSGNIINLTAVWRGRSNTGRYWSNSNGSYFRFGNIVVAQNDQDQSHGYVLSGLSNLSSVTTFTAGSYRVDVTSSTWLKIEAEINTATNTLTTFTIKSEDGTTTYVSLSNQTLTSYDYSTVALGYKKGSSVTSSPNAEQLKSIKITQTTQSVSYANYTGHFKDNNGATVKADEVRNGEVGSTVNANSTDKETYYGGGNKYTYKNDGDGVEVVAAGTAELTVVYDKHEPFTATASAVSGGSTIQTDIASVSGYEGETKTLQLHKYIKVGETWYSTATCYVDVTAGGDNEVTYTATAVKYFYEFESLTGGRTDETNKSYSGGVRSRVTQSNSLSTPEEIAGGVYTLTIPYYNSNTTAGKLYLYTVKGGAETDTELTIDCPQGEGTVTKTITIPDGAALKFKNTNGSYSDNGRIDYFILTSTVSATITEAGYATFSSEYPLDLTTANTPSGLTAYYVNESNVTKSNASFTAINQTVAAGEGILLKGAAGTYNIKVAASGTALADNALVATDGNSVAAGNYVFAYNKTTYADAGFYILSSATTVAKGKAYLDGSKVPASVKALSIVVDGEATGIAAPEVAEKAEEGVLYNLNGQVVTEDYKGIVIKNGKKFYNK